MLIIKNLGVGVSGKIVVDDFNLSVKPGQIHAVMGPNGSGKSSLAYALAGHPHYQITSGTITLNNQILNDHTPDQRAKKGLFLAFQYPLSVSGVPVQNFLKLAYDAIHPDKPYKTILSFRQELKAHALELGIKPELLERSLNEGFSGGEKKRIEILQLLVLKPHYAVLDETDSGLDIDSIKLVAKAINFAVSKFGTGCLIITHYQRILNYVRPNFVEVMVDSHLVAKGGPDMVKKLEKSGYRQWR